MIFNVAACSRKISFCAIGVAYSILISTGTTAQQFQEDEGWLADAKKFSIVGVSVGMSEAEISKSLSPDFKTPTRQQIQNELIGPDHKYSAVPPVSPLISFNSGSKDCLWAISPLAELRKCIEFKSMLYKSANSKTPHKAMSLTLNQYFEYPIELEMFKNRLMETYGQPNVIIGYGGAIGSKNGTTVPKQNHWVDGSPIDQIPFGKDLIFGPDFVLIWSSELKNIQQVDRLKLLDPNISPADLGIKKPILRVFGKMEGNAVHGMEVIVYDPALTKVYTDEDLKSKIHQPDIHDADQIKLQ